MRYIIKINRKLLGTDENGLLTLESEYKDMLKDHLKEYYDSIGIEDEKRQMYLQKREYTQEKGNFVSKEKGFSVKDKPEDELTQEEKDKQIEEIRKERKNHVDMIEPKLIEEDLGIDAKDFGTMTKIKDKRFYDRIPDAKDYDEDAILAYNKKTNEFMIIGMQNGKYVQSDSIEPSIGTMKSTIGLDKDGETVKKEAIGSIMKIKGNEDYDFSINVNLTGDLDFKELRKTEDGKYISSNLQMQGQGVTSWETEKMMDNDRNKPTAKEIRNYLDKKEEEQKRPENALKNINYQKEKKKKEIEREEDDDEWERTPYNRRDPRWG